jgi:hypothetical protein
MEFAVTALRADDSYGCDRPEGVFFCPLTPMLWLAV